MLAISSIAAAVIGRASFQVPPSPGQLRSQRANPNAHRRRIGARRENAPAVIVSEEEDREHACWMRNLDAYVASVTRIQATEPRDARWHSRARCKPFVDQRTQRLLSDIHEILLRQMLHRTRTHVGIVTAEINVPIN
jgi:hypothetical protein